MKLLLLLLPLALLAGCGKYGSFIEANEACKAWARSHNKVIRYKPDKGVCRVDDATRQVLGMTMLNRKVEKRFYY